MFHDDMPTVSQQTGSGGLYRCPGKPKAKTISNVQNKRHLKGEYQPYVPLLAIRGVSLKGH